MTIGVYLSGLFIVFGSAFIFGYVTGLIIRLTNQSIF